MEAPLKHANFNLNIGGIVGFLGGEEAISAMESMHFYRYRKWLGWYNSPGSYTIAKHYGRLARSRIWDGIYPGPNDEPAKLLGLDGKQGPRYRGIVSGTTLNDTGHVGHVFAQYCHKLKATASDYSSAPAFTEQTVSSDTGTIQMRPRKASATNVVVVDFEENASIEEVREVKTPHPLTLGGSKFPIRRVAIASIPISLNIVCCILCGLYGEWFAFGVILYGILCNGIACYFIGSAKIYLKHTIPSPHSPPGNGILEHESDTLIVCRGSEKAINYVVKGRFIVMYGKEEKVTERAYHQIGFSAVLLTTQFIAQLFLIPISGLFGQIMFLSTLAISWFYNAYLSSIDKEQLQEDLLERNLPFRDAAKKAKKLEFPTRTSAVVFAMLCGLPGLQGNSEIFQDTGVWKQWQRHVSAKIHKLSKSKKDLTKLARQGMFHFTERDLQKFQNKDKKLLKDLLDDALGGYRAYLSLATNGVPESDAQPSPPV